MLTVDILTKTRLPKYVNCIKRRLRVGKKFPRATGLSGRSWLCGLATLRVDILISCKVDSWSMFLSIRSTRFGLPIQLVTVPYFILIIRKRKTKNKEKSKRKEKHMKGNTTNALRICSLFPII